jgi:hypothetical protein
MVGRNLQSQRLPCNGNCRQQIMTSLWHNSRNSRESTELILGKSNPSKLFLRKPTP